MNATVANTGPVRPLPPLEAPADIMAEARANCAARARARGHDDVAQDYDAGGGQGWALRFEVMKLQAERGSMPT